MILLISPQEAYATDRLIKEAAKAKVPLAVFDVKDLAANHFDVSPLHYTGLYVRQAYPHFSDVIDLAKKFRDAGKYVVDGNFILNGFETGKKNMYEQFVQSGIPVPQWTTLPLSHGAYEFPYVLKWNYGFGGEGVFLIENQQQHEAILQKHHAQEWLMQKYIKAGWEYKVITVGYKSLPVILGFKLLEDTFKIDVYRYAIFTPEQKPEVVNTAERAARVMGFELAKTDILEKEGELFVLEVNRSPGLLPYEPYSKLNVAGEIVKYLKGRMGEWE